MGIVLIGYRGCGKTTAGRLLAQRRDSAFVDTDALICQFAGKTIAEIFDEEGEPGFRDREQQAIAAATRTRDRVISVGGGAVEREDNRRVLRGYGTVVWLEASAEDIWVRLQADPESALTRPDLAEGGLSEVRSVLARRRPLYAQTSHFVVRTGGRTISEVVDDIEAWLAAS